MEVAKKIHFIQTILHSVFAIGLVFLVGFIGYRYLDFDGLRVVEHRLMEQHPMVQGIEPEIRWLPVKDTYSGEQYWEVVIDPVYATVIPPRPYDMVRMRLFFKAEGVPLVQLGGLVDASGWNFAWQAAQISPLENIDWPCLHDEVRGWWLCQKTPQYRSIENFLLAPPTGAILNFNFELPEGFDRLQVSRYTTDLDIDDFDYIIANYTPPVQQEDGWYEAVAEFSFASLEPTKDGFQFVISAPGIHTRGQRVSIQRIQFEFEKQPLTWSQVWQKCKQKIL